MTHRAVTQPKAAPLYADFAKSFLDRHFSQEVIAALYEVMPKYSRGPRKGLTKGYVHWVKCEKGGWYVTGPGYYGDDGRTSGYVMRPGSHKICVRMTADPLSSMLLDSEANALDGGRIEAIKQVLKELA